MHPNEKGRHCMACQKTVVDFTLMSDTEIIQYFSKASGSVCGRVGSDQLNRKLVVPRPPRKSPWIGWPVLLSGLLFTSDEMGPPRVGKTEIHQCERPKLDGLENVIMGTMPVMRLDTSVIAQVGERHEVLDSIPVLLQGEIIGYDEDTVRVASDTIASPYDMRMMDSIGAGVDSVNVHRALMGWSRNVFDTVKQIVADSLAVVGLKPRESADRNEIKAEAVEVTVYPNPVLRGASLNLLWKKEVEDGRVNLYNINGALIQSWMIQGGSTTRTLMMPADIAAGVYVLQVITKDGGYTRKVVVE
ncbi:MAG: hypothetical protein BGO55_31185 [Sphingobacteriales bacterium 50-39]|nr:MAG: hypothetical protein BGO55_31185 [Sphingobacteriales bacterium 50-39]